MFDLENPAEALAQPGLDSSRTKTDCRKEQHLPAVLAVAVNPCPFPQLQLAIPLLMFQAF
ncbi:hypothetical protein HUU39_15010 [candidate division KSB1 bacterium]|nr:hypothetical protein [bacterium]NUM66551.1 hypothetical protein [candidate division KSB1 bacterium]